MRKALLIGIDHYTSKYKLSGCVHDAQKMQEILQRHEDGSPNFSVERYTSSANDNDLTISKAFLLEQLKRLFDGTSECLLFYFSGHGFQSPLGGYLVSQDFSKDDVGVSFADLLCLANQALKEKRTQEIVIILDCCHSGHMGNSDFMSNNAYLAQGLSILTASLPNQNAVEERRGGVFTQIIREALKGGNSDILGNVTIADVYKYADMMLTPWEQRPMFKTHIHHMTVLRKCKPKIEIEILRKLPSYFNVASAEYLLNPSYEPTSEPTNKTNELVFSHLQAMRAVGLIEPIDCNHLYDAAMQSKSCRLTPVGKFYWGVAQTGKI